jgi:hypothetical protein
MNRKIRLTEEADRHEISDRSSRYPARTDGTLSVRDHFRVEQSTLVIVGKVQGVPGSLVFARLRARLGR